MRLASLLLFLACLLAAVTHAAPNPALAPTLPSSPPPALTALGKPGTGQVENLQVPAGWSMLSFSLGSVDGLDGLTRAPMCYSEGAFHPVTSLPLDPGLGYLVFGDAPGTVRASGQANVGVAQATWLRAGWNLIGCPSTKPLPLSRLALKRPGGVLDVLESAADPSPEPGAAWLYSAATASVGGAATALDLRDTRAVLQPGQVTWVFAWHDAQLLWNADLSKPAPQIASVSPKGQVLEIRGQGFGPSGTGLVTLNGLPVHPEDVVEWTPTSIRLRVPAAATPGPAIVFSHGCPSNRMPFQGVPAAPPAAAAAASPSTGELTGLVLSKAGTPLSGAHVMTDDGHKVVTGADGLFDLEKLPAGPHQVYISRIEYRPGQGQVHIAAGETRRLEVVLSPKSEAPAPAASAKPHHAPGAAPESPEKTTEMHVVTYPFVHNNVRYWTKSIEVNEYGNYGHRWSQYWDTDNGDASFELNCPDAILGRSYDIRVVWRNKLGEEKEDYWQPELQSPHWIFYYYHPD